MLRWKNEPYAPSSSAAPAAAAVVFAEQLLRFLRDGRVRVRRRRRRREGGLPRPRRRFSFFFVVVVVRFAREVDDRQAAARKELTWWRCSAKPPPEKKSLIVDSRRRMVDSSLDFASSFENSGCLSSVACVVRQRDRANRYAAGYSLANMRPRPSSSSSAATGHQNLSHRGLRPAWDGYGWSAASVDGDTTLRLDAAATHPRARQQLRARVFCAAPALGNGEPDPDAEARIGGPGIDTSSTREAFPLGEVDFGRFVPGVCMDMPATMPWTPGGDSSRDIARSGAFKRAFRRFGGSADTAGGDLSGAPSASPPGAPVDLLWPGQHGQQQQPQQQQQQGWDRLVRVAAPSSAPSPLLLPYHPAR